MKNDVRPNLVEEYMNLLLSRIETAEINEHEWWRKLELVLGDSVDSQREEGVVVENLKVGNGDNARR